MHYAANGQLLTRLSEKLGKADKRYYGKESQVLADLDRYDNLVIKDSYGLQQAPSTQDSVHYVSSGDTLQSIASLYFGDSSLWYLIADANGLSGTETLEAGMRLSIPSVSSSINSTDSTFAPVDPLSELGNTTPVAAPKQDKNAERMAACVQVMVTVVVAAIATAATGGMGSPYLAASIVAFTSTLAGDVAGQAVRKYHGLQEDIDWGSAFTSAAVAAVSAAVVPRIPGIKGIKWATAATEAVVNYSLSYVAHNAIGTDRASHWNNRDLLANIATDTAFAAIAKDTPFGNESTQRAGTKNWMQTVNDAAIGAARTVTNAALRTAIDKDTSQSYSERFNQRLDWGAVAASALGQVAGQRIGQSLSNSIANRLAAKSEQQEQTIDAIMARNDAIIDQRAQEIVDDRIAEKDAQLQQQIADNNVIDHEPDAPEITSPSAPTFDPGISRQIAALAASRQAREQAKNSLPIDIYTGEVPPGLTIAFEIGNKTGTQNDSKSNLPDTQSPDYSAIAGRTGTVLGAAGTVLTAPGKVEAIKILNRAAPLHNAKIAAIGNAQSLDAAAGVSSNKAKSTQAIVQYQATTAGKLAKRLPVVGQALELASIPIAMAQAEQGQVWQQGVSTSVAVAGSFAAGAAGFKVGALIGTATGPFAPFAVPILGAAGGAISALIYEFGGYGTQVKNYTLQKVQ